MQYIVEEALAEVRDWCAGADNVEILNASAAAPPNLFAPLVAELTGVYNLPVFKPVGK